MIKLHFGVKQLRIGKTIRILQSFVWNCVKYANKEGTHKDSHIILWTIGLLGTPEFSMQ